MSKKLFFSMFAFAAMLCSSVLTSCGDDDPEPTPVPEPTKTEYKVEFAVVLTPEQMQYFNETYSLKYPNVEKTISISDMTDVSNNANYEYIRKEFKSNLGGAFLTEDQLAELKIYTYTCGTYTTGKFQLLATPITIKADHPTDVEDFPVVESECFILSDVETNTKHYTEWSKFEILNGVLTDDESLKGFIELYSEQTHSYEF